LTDICLWNEALAALAQKWRPSWFLIKRPESMQDVMHVEVLEGDVMDGTEVGGGDHDTATVTAFRGVVGDIETGDLPAMPVAQIDHAIVARPWCEPIHDVISFSSQGGPWRSRDARHHPNKLSMDTPLPSSVA
jgi:hypothetical protein